ncbi:Hsp70 family protein [Actinomycetes bacterium KLBMP 9797]
MSGHQLGIDYGTSHTVAAVRWPDGRCAPLLFDGSPLMPSAVFLDPGGELVAGRDAQHGGRLDPTRFAPNPKRHIDDGTLLLGTDAVPLVEAVAATLRRVAAEAVRACGAPPAGVAMTYPAGWGAVRRGVLVDAAARAGLPAPRLVPEPVAAAGYFTAVLGHAVRPGQLLVVYDLGAGTFDLGVVCRTGAGFEVRDVDGLADFGGLDLDALVVARVGAAVGATDPAAWQRITAPGNPTDQRYFRALWDDARTAKEILSRQSGTALHVPLLDREVPVGREEFEESAGPYLARAAALTGQVMDRAGVTAANLAGVFLVGGASRVPLAATTLHHATGVAPTVLEQPELVVAQGALHTVHTAPSMTDAATPPAHISPAPPPPYPPPAAPPAPVPPAGAVRPSAMPAAGWAVLAAVLTLLPAALLAFLPLMLSMPLRLGLAIGAPVLVRQAVAWRPRTGAGFARRRAAASVTGSLLTGLAALALPVGLLTLTIGQTDDDAAAATGIGLVVAGIAVLLALAGIGLLIRGLRAYPRLVVHAEGLTYQPDARHRYELPWTALVRVDLAPLGPGRVPAVLAVPPPDSPLLADPAYADLWEPTWGALVIDDLDRLSGRLSADLPRLATALAYYRAPHDQGVPHVALTT